MPHRYNAARATALALLLAAAACGAAAQKVHTVSIADNAKSYRKDGARYLYGLYADSIYHGVLPPLLHAIVVVETELDADGNVRDIKMIRVPSHAPEVVTRVRAMIRAASPLPAPARLGGTKYFEVWLVHKSGLFQLDTLTEGQR